MEDTNLPAGTLDRIRALLAKAESTPFSAEADAFTAKAQELMARHRIEQAVFDSASGDANGPTTRCVVVARPYANAKASLLGGVGRANGCRAVWDQHAGTATLVGFPDELRATEELFTSLLVQASAALQRAGPKQDAWGRSRTVRFRRTFLVAFARRVRQRLAAAVDDVVAATAAPDGTAVVPLLQARERATEEACRRLFPHVRAFSPAATDREGWIAGTVFADHADLGAKPRQPAVGGPESVPDG